jgi:TonB family protein
VTPPRRLVYRGPRYPYEAYPAQGVVKLGVIVDENGLPAEIRVRESPSPALSQATVEAVRAWRYEPARKHGVRVRVEIPVQLSFSVRDHW